MVDAGKNNIVAKYALVKTTERPKIPPPPPAQTKSE